jgi:hypothetical protein
MRFVRLSYAVLQIHMSIAYSAVTDRDLRRGRRCGERGLRARRQLTAMNNTFATTRLENGFVEESDFTGGVEPVRQSSRRHGDRSESSHNIGIPRDSMFSANALEWKLMAPTSATRSHRPPLSNRR